LGHHLSCPPTHTGNSCCLPLSPKLNYVCLFLLLLLLYTNKIQCQSNPGKTDHSVASQNIFVMISSGVLTALSCDFIKCGERAPPFSFFSRRKFSPFLHKPDYTSGFWPHPSLGFINMPNGALRAPPAHRSFATCPKIKKIVQKQNASLLARAWAARGVYLSTGPLRLQNIIFHAPRPTYRTVRTLLSYPAPY
jgi:hypothetical protein